MKRCVLLWLLPLAFMVSACQSVGSKQWQAARLSAADVQIQSDVTAALRELLSASSVLLDANELTRSSHLIVERAPYQDEAGTKVYANGFENPQVFRLEVQAGQCRLIQLKTGQSRPLTQAKCTPFD